MNRKLTLILFGMYGLLLGYSGYYNNTLETGYKLDYLVVAFCTPWLVYVCFNLLRLKLTPPIIIVTWVFSAFSTILGSTLGFYRFTYFDKLLHFSSGLFISILCMMLYSLLQPLVMKNKQSFFLQLLFVNGMNMMVAFLWELYEFALLVFFDIDAVNHYTTGVFDSMGDMFVCFSGGLIMSVFIYHYYRTQKANLVYRMVHQFRVVNQIKDSSL